MWTLSVEDRRPDPRSSPRSGPAGWSIPRAGTAATNQIILVEGERIREIGPTSVIPPDAEVIDLSKLTVLPGLVDTHTHMAMTYKEVPENNIYYYTYVMDSTPLRAIQAASNALQLLSSGFTVIRDVGNNGLYADTALRQAIEQGWMPGPTVIPSGIIIGTTGGQFTPTPEMYKLHNIVYPEYLEANSRDEIVKAVRENLLFGAKVIKICVDCKPWGYSVDDIKLFISRSGQGRRQGQRARADARRRRSARSTPVSTSSRTASRSRPSSTRRWRRRASTSRARTRRSPTTAARQQGQQRAADAAEERVSEGACRSPSRPTWITGTSR